jgi:hypothetical protein
MISRLLIFSIYLDIPKIFKLGYFCSYLDKAVLVKIQVQFETVSQIIPRLLPPHTLKLIFINHSTVPNEIILTVL